MPKVEKVSDNSLFFNNLEHKNDEYISSIITDLKMYSETNNKQVYITNEILGNKKNFKYDIKFFFFVLMPKFPITVVIDDDSITEADIEDFKIDLKSNLYTISTKYDYDKMLGRYRKWPEDWFYFIKKEEFDYSKFLKKKCLNNTTCRKIELLISLIVGSINDIDKIGEQYPDSLLEKVKRKIVLFDAKQSGFIYKNTNNRRIVIQGMAGTGKTELLLHKLKQIYSLKDNKKIAFTCHNKVLAADMRKRIPQFFNFMKVDEQIDWDDRLHVFSSWGSHYNNNSGLYSYICNFYNIPFYSYSTAGSFDFACSKALTKLNEIENYEKCFDYIFIDESQDFTENFFKLCENISTSSIFIAGDIFQNIYDTKKNTNINPDYLLNNCYRTDPRTFMFAHAVGLGLYEKPPKYWLKDKDWEACGYIINKENDEYSLSRNPIRRFEDLDEMIPMEFIKVDIDEYENEIVNIIKNIKKDNIKVIPDDICIILIGDYPKMCGFSDNLCIRIYKEFNWKCTKGYETKTKTDETIYISNINNIKGLEFPFVICVSLQSISDDIRFRNSLYMALTRSFLTTYFIINSVDKDFYNLYSKAIKNIETNDSLIAHKPSDKELEEMNTRVDISLNTNQQNTQKIINSIFENKYPNIPDSVKAAAETSISFLANNLNGKEIENKIDEIIKVLWG